MSKIRKRPNGVYKALIDTVRLLEISHISSFARPVTIGVDKANESTVLNI